LGYDREGGEELLEEFVGLRVKRVPGSDANEFCRKKFEVERLSVEDVEMEALNFYYADYSR
jgi:hypothetical protein